MVGDVFYHPMISHSFFDIVGKLGKIFFKQAIENGLSSTIKHMREEGENLKIIL
jgi:hypothetical protein